MSTPDGVLTREDGTPLIAAVRLPILSITLDLGEIFVGKSNLLTDHLRAGYKSSQRGAS